MKFRFR